MSPPNEVVGIDVVARLDAFKRQLGEIPDIGAREARQLVTALSREIKGAERASRAAADASRAAARATRDYGSAAAHASGGLRGMTASLAKAMIGTELLFRGVRLLGRGIRETVQEAVRLDKAAGGDLAPTLDGLRASADALWSDAVRPLIPAITDLAAVTGDWLDVIRDAGTLTRWAQGLSDVAQGAAIAARAVLGLDAAERQRRAASETGQAAIQAQAERIEATRLELTILESLFGASAAAQMETGQRLTREIETLRRLRGELADLANIGIGEPAPARGAPAAAGKASPKGRDQDRMKGLIDPAAVEDTKARLQELTDAYAEAAASYVGIKEEAADAIDSIDQERHEAALRRISEETAARRSAAREWLSVAGAWAGATEGLVEGVSAVAIAATKEETEERLEAQRAAWWAQAIASIATAAVNVPLSISQASTAGYPQAIGYMVAAGVASGIALAGVIAKVAAGPGFHAGGMAPDEDVARILPGEAVLPRQTVRSLGEERVREIIRGDDSGGQVVVINRVGHRTTDVQTHESLRRRRGPLSDAIRATQPRSGSHVPWR